MISFIQPLAAGNALRISLEIPDGATSMRLLRKVSDSFSGWNDPAALVVADATAISVLDAEALFNGTLYYYRSYYLINGTWTDSGATRSATPAATYQEHGVDVLSLVRERLDLGLQAEVLRGTLTHQDGHIPVYTAPPVFDETKWPIVTVHLQGDASAERAIGELVSPDEFDSVGEQWDESEGWLANVQVMLMAWSLNPDQRLELRKAIKRIIIANLPVFGDAGMMQVQLSMQDTEDFESYSAPVYQAMGTLSCTSMTVVGSNVDAINDVAVTQHYL